MSLDLKSSKNFLSPTPENIQDNETKDVFKKLMSSNEGDRIKLFEDLKSLWEILSGAKAMQNALDMGNNEINDVATPINTVADAATITFDLSLGNRHQTTLGGNRTLALSNAKTGQIFYIKLIQDATGSRTVTWFAGISWPATTAPTLTTTINKADVFIFICTGTNTYDGFTVGLNL